VTQYRQDFEEAVAWATDNSTCDLDMAGRFGRFYASRVRKRLNFCQPGEFQSFFLAWENGVQP
jgi:hypothetical protein